MFALSDGTPASGAFAVHPDMLSTQATPQAALLHDGREKPVVVTGAGGFVGMHVCHALSKVGWRIRALVRTPEKAAARLAHLPVDLKVGDLTDAAFVRSVLDGAGAVVHLAAVAIERHSGDYHRNNADVTRLLVDAAIDAGVERFVHMSQNGSDSASPYDFLRSKGVAQDTVAGSTLRWTILRPSVIFGPEDAFVNVLARLVRLSPVLYPLPGGGTSCFQPVHVDDVATAVSIALDNDGMIGSMYPLGGPAPLSLHQMAERILLAMQAKRTIVGIPVAVLRPVIAIVQRVLPNPPVTTGLLDLLSIDNTVPENAITSAFGITPTPFAPEELLYLRRITAGEALRSLFTH